MAAFVELPWATTSAELPLSSRSRFSQSDCVPPGKTGATEHTPAYALLLGARSVQLYSRYAPCIQILPRLLAFKDVWKRP